jgi:flagellin
MTVRINTNVAALRAAGTIARVERDSFSRRARLASGRSVSSARDGGAPLSVSMGMRAEIGGLAQGTRNTERATDLLRTAEGAMNEIGGMLLRMRELAVQSASDTVNDTNREAMDSEFNQLRDYIDRTARVAKYNDSPLLSGFGNSVSTASSTAMADAATTGIGRIFLTGAKAGTYRFVDSDSDSTVTLGNGVVTQTLSFGVSAINGEIAAGTDKILDFDRLGVQVQVTGMGAKGGVGSYADGELDGRTIVVETGTGGSFQLGSDSIPADRLEYDIKDFTVDGKLLNIAQLSVGTRTGARLSLAHIDGTIDRVAAERGAIGAVMNRLQHTTDFTSNALERVQASESAVGDADYAWETSKLARNEIVRQTSVAVMLQSRIPLDMIMGLLQ